MLLRNFHYGFSNDNSWRPKNMNGSTANYWMSLNNMATPSGNCHYGGTASGYWCVVIGAGDTAPTLDDYDLADGSIMANDKMKSMVQTASYSDNGGAIVTCNWMNNSANPITIKEIGLSDKLGGGAYDKASNCLAARTVLDSPITVQPGETYAFSYGVKV